MSYEFSVLIADDNTEFGDMLYEFLGEEKGINVLAVARDGVQAVEFIARYNPDIVILDIVMPKLDGIGVLERTAKLQLEKRPQFLVLSAIGQDMLVQRAVELGAGYFIIKPFDIDVLVSRLCQMYSSKHTSSFTLKKVGTMPDSTSGCAGSTADNLMYDLQLEITNIMNDIGISANLNGCRFIREAVLEKLKNPRNSTSVTKVLYPAVAKKFNTTPEKVERAIRNAIEAAWSKGGYDVCSVLLGYSSTCNRGVIGNRSRPTNSEFIAMLADRIGLKFKNELMHTDEIV